MPIPLAAAAAIATILGVTITIGQIGTDYASDEKGFERLRSDMKTAARQNDYVVASRAAEEYFFLHREDWENPATPTLTSTGYTNPAIQAMRIFAIPKGTTSACRCVSFRPKDGFFSNEWIVTTWNRKPGSGLSRKIYTATTAEASAVFKDKYINGDLAMQKDRRQKLEIHGLA
ncbi:hypothetical protein F1188_08645 [Roseospira marina]|uniref:Uncharacterized protein n=1 Tax=Roseospira marina TaxID=140057 RepID=A0A5M6IDM7_9PROT|nr:hypothetical protein [Roseospira marina]KAA5606067.1 hypothetical protein F1188_08645 [Roseospira marina]MBB4313069.1 hypothetical protein [Roseospira marina]MBB5086190.1 hypothetical protein [Roseospira marina]